MSTTALTLITAAFGTLNVFQAGEPIGPDIAQDAFSRLNGMLGQWALDGLTIPAQSREVFALVANQASYTIGPGGNFNTTRPPSQASIAGVGIYLGTPAMELQRDVLTDQQYQGLVDKTGTSGLFSSAYYMPTFAGGLGTFYLFPIPGNALNSFVLYRRTPLGSFVSLSASYDLPTGYDEAISDNLVLRLATPYGRPLTQELKDNALTTLANIRRANITMSEMGVDPLFLGSGSSAYDIYQGGAGGAGGGGGWTQGGWTQ